MYINVIYSLLNLNGNSKVVMILLDPKNPVILGKCQAIGKCPFYNVQPIGFTDSDSNILSVHCLTHLWNGQVGDQVMETYKLLCQIHSVPKASVTKHVDYQKRHSWKERGKSHSDLFLESLPFWGGSSLLLGRSLNCNTAGWQVGQRAQIRPP